MTNHYTSITEIPIYNFDVLCKTGDFNYLLKDGNSKLPEDLDEVALWSNIYNEFLDTFGLSKDFHKYLKLRAKATRLYKEALVDGKKHLVTFAKLADLQALDAIKTVEVGDLSTTSAALSKHLGFRINPMEIPVKEYYAYIHQPKDNG